MNNQLQELNKETLLHKEIFSKLNISADKLEIFDEVLLITKQISEQIATENIDQSYLKLYSSHLSQILKKMIFRGKENSLFLDHQGAHWKAEQIENFEKNTFLTLENCVKNLSFQINLFEKIGSFNSNIVIIGANGSGKTSLADKLKGYLNNNGVVISAQRILLLPNFESVSNTTATASKLKEEQTRRKTYKDRDDFRFLSSEFEIVLKHLLAENIALSNNYKKEAFQMATNGKEIMSPPKTNLDTTFEIWNSLIDHRYLDCEDGITIKTYSTDNGISYPSIQMSDGEKVLLYLIAQVLLAPLNGFVVVDEPEMYLHKTILKKLWDEMETKRNDCLFIYLTHDLDFATSRTNAKKIWIKSYTYPNFWDIESIESEEIPEALLFELLGSKKNILFCEGEKGSLDEKIFSKIFPGFTISPVGSCFNVINHTKAFNKIKNIHISGFGLIDSDHHSLERLDKISKEGIFNFSLAEIENLFLDEDFLLTFAEKFLSDQNKIGLIKEDIICELEKLKEVQIANYLSAKINNIFTDSDLSEGNTLDGVKNNYQNFLGQINIDEFYNERLLEIDQIIAQKDYNRTLQIFNNKGLKKIAARHFGITDFKEKSLKLIDSQPEVLTVFKKYFPEL